MLKLERKTIGRRLGFLTFLLMTCLVVVGVFAILNSRTLSERLSYSTTVQLPAIRNMTLVDMMHDGIRANVFRAVIISGSKDPNEIKEVRLESEEFATSINENLDSIAKLPLDSDILGAVAGVKPSIDSYVSKAHDIVELALNGKSDKALSGLPSFSQKFDQLEEELDKLGKMIRDKVKISGEEANEAATRSRLISYIVMTLSLIVGFFVSFFISRGLKRQLNQMISALGSESQNVSETAVELSKTAVDLNESATKQASALQETASSLEEITSMVKKTSENSGELKKSAQSSHESASRGEQTTIQMISAIEEISESNAKIMTQIEEGNGKISEIVKVISEIGNKTNVINDIVFQTKLLSFNASVEAARAGEHGKGFAVVAEEVGNLAQISGNAAKEISSMLDSSIKTVNTIVSENKEKVEKLISDGRAKLEIGKEVSTKCKQVLEEIVNQSTEVSRLISEITIAIQEQNQGIQEISKALHLLDQNAHSTSSMSAKTSETSDGLLKGSNQLQSVVMLLQGLAIGGDQKK